MSARSRIQAIGFTSILVGLLSTAVGAASSEPTKAVDKAFDLSAVRCERLGYTRDSADYRDCVREQLRLLAKSDVDTTDVKTATIPATISTQTPIDTAIPKKFGTARIVRIPTSDELVKLATSRKLLGAISTIRVCVDRNGKLVGEPTVAYSSADQVFDQASREYAKKGQYMPPPETETVSGGCVSFRVQVEQNYDKKSIPLEIVNALVETAKSSSKFDLADATAISIKLSGRKSDSPFVDLEYKIDTSRRDVGNDRSASEEFEFRRWQLARQLCIEGEWSALIQSGVRVLATFSTQEGSEISPFQVLVNAPVCERQGIRLRADMGDKDAAYALGNSYRRGGVVWRENPEAYFWYSIAEKLGHDDAQRMRLETAKYLNSPQIDQMRQRIEKWAPMKDR
jgi:hypothetical protein